ncbi:hypothetical protein [Flavobacterium sp.]|uniref:hypothetical protein n=1 Tax=Flavobacterium sp. TaxID=239 RepID=UPI000EE43B9A|nr:hypothetical protein [Flavobacterium sp.]HCQ12341.1 hypothetical protein [Flavobacterium sp.]
MDRLKQHFLLLIVTINSALLFAQNSNTTSIEKNIKISTSETVYIQTNNDALITGETLYYQLYCLNPINFKPSDISKIAHVKLVSVDNKVIVEQKLTLKNGAGNGDIFIPSNLNSGVYKLVGYTNWSLNKNDFKYYTKDITIINPFQVETKDLIAKSIATTKNLENNSNSTTSNGTLVADKKNYSPRELVNFKVNSANQLSNGNYSVSIKKVDAFVSNKSDNPIAFSKINSASEISSSNKSVMILPELRGEIISGEIKSKNSQNSVNSVSIGLSIPGENFFFKVVKTNPSGKFYFTIDQDYSNPNIIVQVVSPYRNEYEIAVNGSTPIELKTLTNNFSVNETMISAIKERAIATQIENAYFNTKKDSVLAKSNTKAFYKPLEKDYILDAYNRFPTLLETIIEVLKEVYYEKNNNQYKLGVRDYDETIEVSEPTLVLVDGIMIQDANELIDLKMDTIYKVSIIQGGYYYGSNIFNGMISFISKNHDYELKTKGNFIANSTQINSNLDKDYYKPDYSKEENKRIPDYRHQLLWLPQYDVSKPISFYTSDVKGTFEVKIEGFTTEGLPVYLTDTFNVN